MNHIKFISILFISLLLLSSCNERNERVINFNHGWKFKLVDETNGRETNYFDRDFDDSSWDVVNLPHTAHLEPLLVNDQWQGTCWYRKNFSIPQSYKGKKVYIEFEAAMNHSIFYINGNKVKVHQGGYLPVIIDFSKYLNYGGPNILAVRLNNTDNAITGPKPLKILDFNMYGGLYRNVKMKVKNKVHISEPVLANKVAGGGVFITYPKVDKKESIVRVKTHILNTTKDAKSVEVVNAVSYKGKTVNETKSTLISVNAQGDKEAISNIVVKSPKLWSPDSPELYQLRTSVIVNGEEVDVQITRFGIRKFEFVNNKLYINGEKTFLRGVNRHQEYPFIGYALSDNAQYRDAKKIKDAGFNYIRLSHYPQSPAFMDACDELGLVVADAILGWQYYLDNQKFRDYCYRSAKELIYRDRNHPCVLAWEVSLNETQMPVFFMEELHEIVHEQYPGKNVYSCGWMDDVYDIYFQARQHRIMHPHELKDKPYAVSEYGDWEYYSNNAGLNQHQLDKQTRFETSSRQKRSYGEKRLLQQAYNVQEAHNDNLNTPAFADGYWVMYDYNRGYHDDLEASGIMDIFRLPKFAYYFYQSQKHPKEEVVLNIASYWTKESPLNLKVYSNCEEVELFLNNKVIAKQTPDMDSVSNNLSHPPFTFTLKEFKSGTLKAVGYISGKKVKECAVTTPGKASGIKIWIDEGGRKAQSSCNDVLFVYAAAIDDNGIIVPDYEGEVFVEVGEGMTIMNVDEIKAEAGIATALVRIEDASFGKVSVSADGLKDSSLKFEIQ